MSIDEFKQGKNSALVNAVNSLFAFGGYRYKTKFLKFAKIMAEPALLKL